MKWDYMIVGAGLAGSVLAERLANQLNATVLLIDRRKHSGGNCFDSYDEHGVLIHNYGPHLFHTNSQRVFDYLSRFTGWLPASYKVKSSVQGALYDFPLNLNTFEQLLKRPLNKEIVEYILEEKRVKLNRPPKNSEEQIVSQIGWNLYRMFFQEYTRKQWARDPTELDASVLGRIPIRTNREDRYFTDKFQMMPEHGYSAMFAKMLAHPNIRLMLDADFHEMRSQVDYRHLIYTGPLDAYFDFRLGALPYRSLRFEFEHFADKQFHQPAVIITYPEKSKPYTRITEIKHVTGQDIKGTTISREYPTAIGEPYYPVPSPEPTRLRDAYLELAEKETNTSFVGRLATYRYYNMDQVVGMALAEYDRIISVASHTSQA